LKSFEKSIEKLVPQIETSKQSRLRKCKHQVKRRTHNHWHGRLETYPLCYKVEPFDWQTNRFIQTASCEVVW